MPGSPASISVVNQPISFPINSSPGVPLIVKVVDANGNAVSGVTVTFWPQGQGNGASCTFAGGVNTAVTDENGKFELTDVPPGQYQIVAWHEGWKLDREESAFDVLTERKVRRPVFSDPRTWEKQVTVGPDEKAVINFVFGEK